MQDKNNFDNFIDNWKGKILQRILNTPMIIRILIISIGIFLVFIYARKGGFGETIKEITFIIPNHSIPFIDPIEPELRINLKVFVYEKDKYIPAKIGGTYKFNDAFKLEFDSNYKCWLLILNVDNINTNSLYPYDTFETIWFEPDKKSFSENFRLDNTKEKNIEIIYAIASKSKFDYTNDISKFIKHLRNTTNFKGLNKDFDLKLPSDFTLKVFHFYHIKD